MTDHDADLLIRADPTHVAVRLPDDTGESASSITYQSIWGQRDEAAASLRGAGLVPGDAVGIVLPNGPEFLVSFLGVTAARLIAAPLNAADTADEWRFALQDANVRALIFDRLPATIWLVSGAAILWLLMGIPVGIISAV